MKPHSRMSMATKPKSGTIRVGLPRIRYHWRSIRAKVRDRRIPGRFTLPASRFPLHASALVFKFRVARDGDEEFFEGGHTVLFRQRCRIALEQNPSACQEKHPVTDLLHLQHIV